MSAVKKGLLPHPGCGQKKSCTCPHITEAQFIHKFTIYSIVSSKLRFRTLRVFCVDPRYWVDRATHHFGTISSAQNFMLLSCFLQWFHLSLAKDTSFGWCVHPYTGVGHTKWVIFGEMFVNITCIYLFRTNSYLQRQPGKRLSLSREGGMDYKRSIKQK